MIENSTLQIPSTGLYVDLPHKWKSTTRSVPSQLPTLQKYRSRLNLQQLGKLTDDILVLIGTERCSL
ncbi:uncharacterized protein PHALS_13605 [Plasmopara halstedii]|uniref:Uncharacterized protein n=1 Tax=Plasmopara halstedii TaxID=4781 RepID=A0A0P1APQ6_PLAHL|nr:uncharacterized protein PHALS_13605 [Plasmopara halstedii]CEG43408.1 hypothetical protein PHALS_13605 [Plasmopara halstedii]|eukprot:XP_024579777.1 hypothetical protein PHALS_13605 [Plasmopara halstedii]